MDENRDRPAVPYPSQRFDYALANLSVAFLFQASQQRLYGALITDVPQGYSRRFAHPPRRVAAHTRHQRFDGADISQYPQRYGSAVKL